MILPGKAQLRRVTTNRSQSLLHCEVSEDLVIPFQLQTFLQAEISLTNVNVSYKSATATWFFEFLPLSVVSKGNFL